MILQHPLFDKLLADADGELPDRFKDYRVSADDLPEHAAAAGDYRDPLAADAEGGDYRPAVAGPDGAGPRPRPRHRLDRDRARGLRHGHRRRRWTS